MEVIGYQIVIVISIFVAYKIKPQYGFWAAIAWTVETIVLLFFPPLIIIQLVVVWSTYGLLKKSQRQRQELLEKSDIIETLREALADHPEQTRTGLQMVDQSDLKFIAGREHADYLRSALEEANDRLLILSGWISTGVVNGWFIKRATAPLERGANISLGYGWADSSGANEESRASKKALISLQSLQSRAVKKSWAGQLKIARFGNHEKILVLDERLVICGSNN